MSEQLYVCENAAKCEGKPCVESTFKHCIPHAITHCPCDKGDCMIEGGIRGSRCIPFMPSPSAPVATAIDPDVAMARRTANEMLHCGLISKDFAACILRLADKVEGKAK